MKSVLKNKDKTEFKVISKLVKAIGSKDSVTESREIFDKIRVMIEADYASVLKLILAKPKDVLNWDQQVATLIGEARTHQKYIELFTIQEK